MPEACAIGGRLPALGALPEALVRGLLLALSRGVGIAGQMLVQIVVGAMAGPAAIGVLQLHMAWGTLLGELIGGGRATRAMRDTAIYHAQGNQRRIGNVIISASATTVRCAVLLAIPTFAMLWLQPAIVFDAAASPPTTLILAIVLSAPLFALTRLLADALKSLDRALWAVTLENSAIPLTILAMCAILALLDTPLSTSALLVAAIGGLLLGMLALAVRVWRDLSGSAAQAPRRSAGSVEENHASMQKPGELLHFWLNGLLNIAFLQLPFLIMPWITSAEDIGRYAVAHKLLNVITTLLILLAAVYGPRFARAAAAGDGLLLRRLLRQTQIISTALFAPAALAMLFLATPLTALFALPPGSLLPLLIILAAGQLLNALTGLSGVLLNMSGAPQLEMRLLLCSALLTAALALALGLQRGAEGVAMAIALGITARNIGSYVAARFHLLTLEQANT